MRKTIRTSTMYKKKSNTSKKRMSRKIYRKRHSKRNHMKGGNFGGNCPDPNFSIYNTNLLKLFPYHF
jgi:hypothetical protein